MEYNLDVSDISYLLSVYQHENGGVKNIIKNISVEYITEIINQNYFIPFELLSELIATNKLTMEIKMKLFVQCLPKMNNEQAKEYLLSLQMNDFLSLFAQKRPRFKVNSINEQILTIFQDKNWITRFDVEKEDSGYYRAFGRRVDNDRMLVELL